MVSGPIGLDSALDSAKAIPIKHLFPLALSDRTARVSLPRPPLTNAWFGVRRWLCTTDPFVVANCDTKRRGGMWVRVPSILEFEPLLTVFRPFGLIGQDDSTAWTSCHLDDDPTSRGTRVRGIHSTRY